MNHQIASSTTMTIRMIAHIGKPLEVGATTGAVTLDAAASALLAVELAVELAAVAALETVDVAVWVAAAAAPPRPARSPEAPSNFETSGGSAAEIALFWLLSSERIAEGSDQFEGSCWPIVPTAASVAVPSKVCVAGCGAPEYWLMAPARLARPPPPSRPVRSVPPSLRNRELPPPAAWLSEARIAGTAAATTFCATASFTPSARAKVLIICGVRNCDTRLTRLIAIAAFPSNQQGTTGSLLSDFRALGAPRGIGKLVADGVRLPVSFGNPGRAE